MADINIFLLCFNESALLPHTIKHYKKYVPSCKITIYDNESTDNSVEIAKELGCSVVSWNSKNIHDGDIMTRLRNSVWKTCVSGWIIMADMDEFICVTEEDLQTELASGTTILKIQGYEMIGESATIDLSDIDLQDIRKFVSNRHESKNLCFLREAITEMNYGPGSHKCRPSGTIKYSARTYINKHMNYLGLNFITDKMIKRYNRSHKMRAKGHSTHYTNDVAKIRGRYGGFLKSAKMLGPIA